MVIERSYKVICDKCNELFADGVEIPTCEDIPLHTGSIRVQLCVSCSEEARRRCFEFNNYLKQILPKEKE